MPHPFGPLISSARLAELIAGDEPPAILDVRWDVTSGPNRAGYLGGHIPGARFVDLDRQLADPPSERGRHPLPRAERFGIDMRGLGVSDQRPVVVYDAATSIAAARAWWLLRYFGHPQVAVLDGGLAGWVEAGHPLTGETAQPVPGDFVPRPGAMPVLTPQEAGVLAAQGVLLDARARERYLGLTEPIDPVAGHIPNACNRPTAENLDARGRFRDASVLRTGFEALGVRDDAPVGAYCGSGITAAHQVLALELAGYRAALYPGSWSEWIADPSRPLATGDDSVPDGGV